jgi:hypothetical protein
MPVSLTENNLRAIAGNDDEKMTALLERGEMISQLLGKVNDLLAVCPSDTASRPPSTRPPPASSSRPDSSRPPSTGRLPTGGSRPVSGPQHAQGAAANLSKAPMLRLTTGHTEHVPSAIDRFLAGSSLPPTSRQPKPEPEEGLRLYDEGLRMAEQPGGNDENGDPQPVRTVRYTGRQHKMGQMQRLKRNDAARAAQSSVANVVFGGGE